MIGVVLHEEVEQLLQIALVVVARRNGGGDVKELAQNATDERSRQTQRIDKVHSHTITHSLQMNTQNKAHSRVGERHRDTSVGKTHHVRGLRTILSKEKRSMRWNTQPLQYIENGAGAGSGASRTSTNGSWHYTLNRTSQRDLVAPEVSVR